jgi:hypothetical protein
MPHRTPSPATELHAFCTTCPPAEEVTALLAKLGFRLTFQMEAQDDLRSGIPLPALPAQYHYKDAYGTEVLYLAGTDTPLEGEDYPPHASRFWLYAGAQRGVFRQAMSSLALAFQFTWRDPAELDVLAQQEVA